MERKILQRMEQLEKIKKGLEKRLQGVQIRKVECKKNSWTLPLLFGSEICREAGNHGT